MTGFIYIWRDRKHNRYYIGSHWGKETDKYICSSWWMKRSYKKRPHDFKRRILERVHTTRDELLEIEHKWLQRIKEEELGTRYYNLRNHKFNHWTATDNKLSIEEKISNKVKQLHQTPEYQQKFLEGRAKLKGTKYTSEQIEARRLKIIEGWEKSSPKELRKKRTKMGSQEFRDLVSIRSKESYTNMSLETKIEMKRKQSEARLRTKDSPARKGLLRWNNGIVNKYSKECPGEGWVKGMLN